MERWGGKPEIRGDWVGPLTWDNRGWGERGVDYKLCAPPVDPVYRCVVQYNHFIRPISVVYMQRPAAACDYHFVITIHTQCCWVTPGNNLNTDLY